MMVGDGGCILAGGGWWWVVPYCSLTHSQIIIWRDSKLQNNERNNTIQMLFPIKIGDIFIEFRNVIVSEQPTFSSLI